MPEAQAPPQWTRLWPVLCLLPFLGWWLTGLTDLDEGFYGAVAIDMLRRGDWITPSISGTPWFEKPILVYWLAIPSIWLFGEDAGPRLPSVLAVMLLAWMVFWFAGKQWGRSAGILAALALSGSILSVAIGRMMLTDAAFVAALTACFILYWESLQGRPSLRIGSAACLGLAVLAKGPVAGVFFILVAGLLFAVRPETRPGVRGFWLPSVAVGLAVMAAWYLPCWLINGEVFVQKFLIEQNIGRFAGGDEAHRVPVYLHPIYYPVILAVGLLPWLPGAVKGGMFRSQKEAADAGLNSFLWIWALSVLVLFSLSGSKLPHYIFPGLPPLVLLAARAIEQKDSPFLAPRRMALAAGWAVFLMVLATTIFGMEYARQKGPDLHGLVREIRTRPEPVVIYRFGRTDRKVEIQLEINETSRPSIHFYLRKPALKTSDFNEVLEKQKAPFLLLAPKDRVGSEEAALAMAKGLDLDLNPIAQRGSFAVFAAALKKPETK